MKKILRLNFIFSTAILCIAFLLCGIVEINDKTSYVISGEKSEVFHSQKTDGDAFISLTKNNPEKMEDTEFLSLDVSRLKQVAGIAKYCCVPPLGCIISFFEQVGEKR